MAFREGRQGPHHTEPAPGDTRKQRLYAGLCLRCSLFLQPWLSLALVTTRKDTCFICYILDFARLYPFPSPMSQHINLPTFDLHI